MAGKLVTIATFDSPPKARLAQNALTDAGIKAAVADETIVQMDWLLGGAVGWVKVQVMDEDAERAVAVLEEALGGEDDPVDQEALTAEAEAAGMEEGGEPPERPPAPTPSTPIPAPVADEAEPTLSERDEYARRFFLAAIFGLVFAPLWFYAVYLFLNSAFGEGPISSRAKRKLFLGAVILALCLATTYILIAILLAIFGS